MGRLSWYINRLRAMSPAEVMWRLRQKRLQRRETAAAASRAPLVPLSAQWPDRRGEDLQRAADGQDLSQPLEGEAIDILGGYDYRRYATDWHAGFTTPAQWPLEPSYSLTFKQRDDIGDARINWELNRHRQFTRLALMAGREERALPRLAYLLDSWLEANPWLWGISYTSPMEVALRAISWASAARMLPHCPAKGMLSEGARRMCEYLLKHESGFSSANNHLIVEVAAVAYVGAELGIPTWVQHGVEVMTRELPRQVAADGVNLESSLHYHCFVFEAYLMVWRAVGNVPASWPPMLAKMAAFIQASAPQLSEIGAFVFGDDDEARIFESDIPLGHPEDLPADYDPPTSYIHYLIESWMRLSGQELADEPVANFKAGGYSFLRSGTMEVAIDHAPLGFGSIAAHGHNDILSFQVKVAGRKLLTDSGTSLYHTDLPERNRVRSSAAHNVLQINGVEQSQMLGAFLWGKRARIYDVEATLTEVSATVTDLSGVSYNRSFCLDDNTLTISTDIHADCQWMQSFVIAPGYGVELCGEREAIIGNLLKITSSDGMFAVEDTVVYPHYGQKEQTKALRLRGSARKFTIILIPLT